MGQGIVTPGEAKQLREEIAAELMTLKDPRTDHPAIKKAHIAQDVYTGPYKNQAPDIIARGTMKIQGTPEA